MNDCLLRLHRKYLIWHAGEPFPHSFGDVPTHATNHGKCSCGEVSICGQFSLENYIQGVIFCHDKTQIFLTIKVLNWKDKPSRRSGAKVQTIASLINQRPQKKPPTFDTRWWFGSIWQKYTLFQFFLYFLGYTWQTLLKMNKKRWY